MKVTIETNEEKEQEITFPCLMVSKNSKLIILAIEKKNLCYLRGAVVSDIEENWGVGHYSEGWDINQFKPLPKGTKVILEN